MPEPGISADAQTQQYGYIRCYRAVVRDCGIAAAYLYGILEDYAQLGKRTGAGCIPSHEHLAELTGLGLATIKRHLSDLRQSGWISWKRTGDSNVYTIHSKGTRKTAQNEPSDGSKRANGSLKMTDNQEQPNKTDLTSPPLLPPEGGSYTQEFEDFRKAYGPTNGPKKPAFQAWQRLSKAERKAAVAALPAWLENSQWRSGFKPFPQKYLNQRMWEGDPTDLSPNGHVTAADQAAIEAEQEARRKRLKELSEA